MRKRDALPESFEERGTTPHILVIDRSLSARMDIRAALHGSGFHVTACDSKASARQAIRARSYALAIIDAILPDGSGLDLLKELRAVHPGARIPVILLAPSGDVRDRVRIAAAVADEYVTKPYDMGQLLRLAVKLAGTPRRRTFEPGGSASPSLKLLVADGEPAYRRTLAESLRADGGDVAVAGSTDEALALLALERVDAVLLDYRLPDRGGLDTCRRIRGGQSTQRFVPLLVIAGTSDDVDAYRKAISVGADDLVMRSPEPTIVKVRLRSLLSRVQRDRREASARAAAESSGEERISRISGIPPSWPGVDGPPSAGWSSQRDPGEDRISGVVPVSAGAYSEAPLRRAGNSGTK
jgi:DNA-binding response OmpR family regulator